MMAWNAARWKIVMLRPMFVSGWPGTVWPMVVFVAVALLGTAQAKVYKWTDANGKVHYGERPPPGADVENVRIERKATAEEAAPVSASERRARQRKLLKAFEADRKEREADKARARKQDAKRKQACARMKQYIDQEAMAKYLYRKDPKTGEKIPVSDEERAAHMSNIRKRYERSC